MNLPPVNNPLLAKLPKESKVTTAAKRLHRMAGNTASRGKAPRMEQLVIEMISAFGPSVGEFMRKVKDEYEKAKPGSLIRQRILESMLRIMVAHSKILETTKLDMNNESESELFEFVEKLIGKDAEQEDGAHAATSA